MGAGQLSIAFTIATDLINHLRKTPRMPNACSLCGNTALLMYRCGNQSCGFVFCRDCGTGLIHQCCPRCGSFSTQGAGLVQSFVEAIGGPKSAANSRPRTPDVETEASAIAEERRTLRRTQQRLEEEADRTHKAMRNATEEMLRLERDRLEAERRKQSVDEEQTQQAVRLRALTSAVAGYLSAALNVSTTLIHVRSGTKPPVALEALLLGTCCELLSKTIAAEAKKQSDESNPYVTADDYNVMRSLEQSVTALRQRAGVNEFMRPLTSLLSAQANRCEQAVADLSGLYGKLAEVKKTGAGKVGAVMENLRNELGVVLKRDTGHTTSQTLLAHLEFLSDSHDAAIWERLLEQAEAAISINTILTWKADYSHIDSAIAALHAFKDTFSCNTRAIVDESRESLRRLLEVVSDSQFVMLKGENSLPQPRTEITIDPTLNKLIQNQQLPPLEALVFRRDFSSVAGFAGVAASYRDVSTDVHELNQSCQRFISVVKAADKALASPSELPETSEQDAMRCQQLVAVLTDAVQSDVLDDIVRSLRESLDSAQNCLKRAASLIKIGDVQLGLQTRHAVLVATSGLLDDPSLLASASEQRAAFQNARKSRDKVLESAAVKRTGIFNALVDIVTGATATRVQEALGEFYSYQQASWAAGSELCRDYLRLSDSLNSACVTYGYEPKRGPMLVLGKLIAELHAEEQSPPAAFVNALCAMAISSNGIDSRELSGIRKVFEDAGISAEFETFSALLAHWNAGVAKKRAAPMVAQAILNVSNITDLQMLGQLREGIREIARVDGSVSEVEKSVFWAFLSIIFRIEASKGATQRGVGTRCVVDGASIEQAIVVKNIGEEYGWIRRHCAGFEPGEQSLEEIGGRFYDVHQLRNAAGLEKTIYFDITTFYGTPGVQ
jgi:hypothetical protein